MDRRFLTDNEPPRPRAGAYKIFGVVLRLLYWLVVAAPVWGIVDRALGNPPHYVWGFLTTCLWIGLWYMIYRQTFDPPHDGNSGGEGGGGC
jgi:hypothetical protein